MVDSLSTPIGPSVATVRRMLAALTDQKLSCSGGSSLSGPDLANSDHLGGSIWLESVSASVLKNASIGTSYRVTIGVEVFFLGF